MTNRYTKYDPELGRYVVPCLYTEDGGTTISCKVEPGEIVKDASGGALSVSPDTAVLFGEAIDRFAELENEKEKREPIICDLSIPAHIVRKIADELAERLKNHEERRKKGLL